MKNIIIITQNRNFFGAQIVLIPLIQHLKSLYPKSRIVLFSKNKISKIMLDLPEVDEIVFETTKLKALWYFVKIESEIVINLRKSSFFSNLLVFISNARLKVGFENRFSNFYLHKTQKSDSTIYRAQNYLNLFDATIKYLSGLEREKIICIMPGAGGEKKQWPLDNYKALAENLIENYPSYKVFFILGQKETEWNTQLLSEGFNTLYDIRLPELLATIQNASLVIANDCGPSHIAQISDVPNIILYTDEFETALQVSQEWFNRQKRGAFCIYGEPKKSINSIQLDQITDIIKTHNLL